MNEQSLQSESEADANAGAGADANTEANTEAGANFDLDANDVNDITRATELLQSNEEAVDPQEKAALFEMLYDVEMRLATLPASPDDETKLDEDDIAIEQNIYAQQLIRQTPAKTMKQMRALAGDDGARINAICEQVLNGTPEGSRLSLEVHMQGYDSVYQKYVAAKRGLDTEGPVVSALDALATATDPYVIQTLSMEHLTHTLGLPEDSARDIYQGLMGRASVHFGESKTSLFGHGAAKELLRVGETLQEIGPDGLALLREKCGIVNIGELSKEQAHRMIQFSEADPELLEKLRQTETCVIFRDATSDWDGAFDGTNQSYETADGATLIFEISSMKNQAAELKSYIAQLTESDIHPSAVVIAGHGSPGIVRLGDGGLLSSLPPGGAYENSTLLQESGLPEVLSQMKADRSGNCHIIFKSCSQGKTVDGATSENDTMLFRTAELVQNSHPRSEATYHIYGTADESNLRMVNGELEDITDGQIIQVDVNERGDIHSAVVKTATIPMFGKPTHQPLGY